MNHTHWREIYRLPYTADTYLERAICRSRAANPTLTKKPAEVDCPKCLKAMPKSKKNPKAGMESKEDFLAYINSLRLDRKFQWYTYTGVVEGKNISLKGHRTWLQIYKIDGVDYANCMDRSVKQFQEDLEAPFTGRFDEALVNLWERLGDVPVNDDGEIEEDFLHFPTGTDREEIWSWIEETYDVSVYDLMRGIKK
jgi:hypothetical protein